MLYNSRVDNSGKLAYRAYYKKLKVSRQYAYLISSRQKPWIKKWLAKR